jgi:hypothetical protein
MATACADRRFRRLPFLVHVPLLLGLSIPLGCAGLAGSDGKRLLAVAQELPVAVGFSYHFVLKIERP